MIFGDPATGPTTVPSPFPVALVVSDYVVISSRDELLKYVLKPEFNPSRQVALESDPGITRSATEPIAGGARVVDRDTDVMEVQVELQRPAVLVLTNNYSTGWRIKPITSRQREFRVMPANYTHIGIPLESGKHHFLLTYAPAAFQVGGWISILGLLGVGAGLLWLMRPATWLR
jgi:hypothetical protein